MNKKKLAILIGTLVILVPITVYAVSTLVGGTKTTTSVGYNEISYSYSPSSFNSYSAGEKTGGFYVYKNEGCDAYIRARINLSDSRIEKYITTVINSDYWELNDDGYYYYKDILHDGEQSKPLISSYTISSDYPTKYNDYSKKQYYVMYAESVQANGSDNCIEAFNKVKYSN